MEKLNPTPVDWAMPAEIARFMRIELRDVKTLIQSDGLPATRIPKKTRSVSRIWLRDLHQWLLGNTPSPGPALRDYQTFRLDFEAHRAISRKNNQQPTPEQQ